MSLPDSYTFKPAAIIAYLDAILDAEAPKRFSTKFLQNLEFKSTNDRLFIGVLKDLNFIDMAGIPQKRYYEFLDRSQSKKILADAIRETYSDLFTVNKKADELPLTQVKNKLRTLYAGSKKDNIINRISSTFVALCNYADFSSVPYAGAKPEGASEDNSEAKGNEEDSITETHDKQMIKPPISNNVLLDSLQYHINIVLPESRDQAVYDAIFKALKEHLG